MSLELVQDLTGHTDRIWSVAWSPNGLLLATSGGDRAIRLWGKSLNEWTCVSVLTKAHSKSIRRICWSPCGNYLAAASFDGTTSIWKCNTEDSTWSSVVDLDGHDNEVKSVAWSSDGKHLATCGRDRTIWIWEKSQDHGDVEDDASGWDCSDILTDHTKDVKNIKWHPHHNILVSCSYDESIKFFHKNDDHWECFQSLMKHFSTVWSVDFSSSGEYLASCSDNRVVRVWYNSAHDKLPTVAPDSWKCVSVIQGYHSRSIYDVAFCRNMDLIASASGDNSITIYKSVLSEGNLTDFMGVGKRSESHESDVNSLAWNPKTDILASGSDDGHIKLWSLKDIDKGMKILTYEEQLVEGILKFSTLSKATSREQTKDSFKFELTVINHENLLNLIHSLQCLQSELRPHGEDERDLRKHLDFDIPTESNRSPVELSSILKDGSEGLTTGMTISICDKTGIPKYLFEISIDQKQLSLRLPRRSSNLLVVANELFLLEKTGDMFRINDDGTCHFLLGHLFMFTDVKFLTDREGKQIRYIISGDRDEKIRISNYPDTFNIERFCFGHQKFVRRLIILNDNEFVSIDDEDVACVWNLTKTKDMPVDEVIDPVRHIELKENPAKRSCTVNAATVSIKNTEQR